uniref:Uncharacterized protein n=1 Tax=Psilocybe cubensis TaxID=181762 RepID=A0A8H8CFK2_PSICU
MGSHLSSVKHKESHIKSNRIQPTVLSAASATKANSLHISTGPVKKESSNSQLPTSKSISRPLSSSSNSKLQENEQPFVRIKLEPQEAQVPRKRLSDVAFDADRSVVLDASQRGALTYIPSKKVKTEDSATKIPLAQVTNTPIASGSRSSSDMSFLYAVNGLQDPQSMLENVRVAISGQELLLRKFYPITNVSHQDFMKIQECEDELRRLRALEQEYVRHSMDIYSGPSIMQSAQRPFLVKPEPVDLRYPQPQFDRPSTNSTAFPSPMDIDRQPVNRFNEVKPFTNHAGPSSLNGWGDRYNISGSSVVKPEPIKAEPFNLRSSPIASSSRSSPFSIPDIKPSTDVPMSSPFNSDDEDSEVELHVENENAFVSQLGINVPAPIHDDSHDSNGDYHGRGRDIFVGPLANANDIETFLVEAGNAESFDGNASVDKALKYLNLQNLQQKLHGLEISLMPHQVMGVAWMLEKERSSLKGGCLADEMGLGKTVQMIATLIQNRSEDPACKTNLIIAPLALLDQWKQEIETKTNLGLRCHIYHGQGRTRSKSELMKYDVVLTTFHTMAHEWPDYETQMKKKIKAKKNGQDFIVDSDEDEMCNHTYRSNKRKQQAGILFQVEFYRIIADEGQNIRNRRTRMSRAITDLQSTYRWCLTGTPIVNSLADVYGLLRFLKLRPWYDWTHFQSKIGILERKNPGLAVARLQKVMALFLLRRKKDSKLDGRNLIELPEKKIDLVRLEFSEEEREIYNMVEARSQARFNRYLRAGTVLKNYHQVLVLLLRLRQICSHPSLIQEGGEAFVPPEEAHVKPELSTELTRAARLVSPEFVAKMKERFLQHALDRIAAEKNSAEATFEEEDCPICYDAMTDAVVTGCDVVKRAADAPLCPVCRAGISENTLFSRQAFEPTDKELDPDIESDVEECVPKRDKGKGKATARPAESDSDDDDMSDFIVQSDEDEEEKDARRALKKRLGKKRANIILDSDDEPDTPEEKEIIFGVRKKHVPTEDIKLMPKFLPSTKMKYMMDQLQNLARAHPDEKTLLVSQWTGCLSLISDYLTEKGIPHVKYQGDMSRTKRDQAVQIFMSKEKARVMLMSLKCGGVGLNLTRANNVISLDLGWSQAVESQAFDRVHRVGQERKVLVQRVVIADTVEDRILKMQERKQTLADGSLGEGTAKKMGKLSVKELANLFGLDARGRLL